MPAIIVQTDPAQNWLTAIFHHNGQIITRVDSDDVALALFMYELGASHIYDTRTSELLDLSKIFA